MGLWCVWLNGKSEDEKPDLVLSPEQYEQFVRRLHKRLYLGPMRYKAVFAPVE